MNTTKTSGSFKPGYKRSAESIAKQKATIELMAVAGKWVSQLPEVRKKNSGPHPQRRAHHNRHTSPVGSAVVASSGYIKVKVAEPNIWVYEHRLVAVQMIGRPLLAGEEVHHINHNKTDNRPENLVVMDKIDHSSLVEELRLHPRCAVCGYNHPPHP